MCYHVAIGRHRRFKDRSMEELGYRAFLLRIADHFTAKNVEDLKYLCSDAIEEGELEKISNPLQLFKALERRQLLGIDNMSFLQGLLENVKCGKLATEVGKFKLRRDLELKLLVQTGGIERWENDSGGRVDRAVCECVSSSEKEDFNTILHSAPNSCCCGYNHSKKRKTAELHLNIVLKLACTGAWFAGTAYVLKRYINDPETLVKLFASVVLPSGIVVKSLCEGSVLCILEASDLEGLHTLWQNYENGKLKEDLEVVLITEDLTKLSKGEEIILDVVLDREMYQNACLELILVKQKVNGLYKVLEQRPRSLSDPTHGCHGKPESSSQEESLRIMARAERTRRLHAEKVLNQLKSDQLSNQLCFPEQLHLDARKNSQDVSGDDSSSTASTWDEDDVLDWEDENDPSNEFWKSVKGGLKEKSWTDLKDAIVKAFPDELRLRGTPLLKFLAYVLGVNYDKQTSESVSLNSFIRISKLFGPFTKGSKGCISKMIELMERSASLDPDGKKTSWFAGYMTEDEAKEKLKNQQDGAFLVRFNTSMVTPGFVLSTKSRNNDFIEYNIEVDHKSGQVEFSDSEFESLPSLVAELRKSWMKDLQPAAHS